MQLLWLLALATPAPAAPPDPAEIFDKLEATPAQRAALRRVAQATWEDLDSMALPAAHQLVQDAMVAFTSDKIDKATLESARQGAVELFDQTTSELLPRVLEAAEILTPQQRQKAAEILSEEVARWLGAPSS
jgi:Spy/CpxP family protein refolding chaperone